ncbi:hypothetical protein [Nannocystis radixulma]|uniref:Uncharacterized protein n=1 Tax=Nannocystis radixulma TaxID=2995305 RepID=A0ABT5B274_9BACT|nr:hypothetical protein [Nannocystis radixulma]MDC0667780.1 hypothetical protein [Nannocystis radixulma]
MNGIERLEYQFGNEHSPTQRHGRVVLTLAAPDSLSVYNIGRRGERRWHAAVDGSLWSPLENALREAGFPAVPRQSLLPAGSAIRELTVVGDPCGRAGLPWHAALDLPGYATVFAILDNLLEQATEGSLPCEARVRCPGPQPVWVIPTSICTGSA